MKVIIEELTNLDLENLSKSETINWEFIVNMINKIKVNLNKESAWTKDILDIPIFYNEIVLPDNSGIVKHTKIERNNISYDTKNLLGDAAEVGTLGGDQDGEAEVDN